MPKCRTHSTSPARVGAGTHPRLSSSHSLHTLGPRPLVLAFGTFMLPWFLICGMLLPRLSAAFSGPEEGIRKALESHELLHHTVQQ